MAVKDKRTCGPGYVGCYVYRTKGGGSIPIMLDNGSTVNRDYEVAKKRNKKGNTSYLGRLFGYITDDGLLWDGAPASFRLNGTKRRLGRCWPHTKL
jgi:hypothetical protein